MNDSAQALSTCGCCEGIETSTPMSVENLPGLSALAYRVGKHSTFKESMTAIISNQSALRDLTTRSEDDPSIALMDAWAMVLDVLSFYQERIANEGFLRTATERRSILEMARSIGYELRPGVAASTYLAFTLDDTEGAVTTEIIEAGTKAQSVPGQDEDAQIFEAIEDIEVRPEWNELNPKTYEIVLPSFGTKTLYLKSITTNLKSGDALLIVGEEREKDSGSERWDFRRVENVDTDSDEDYTVVTLNKGLGSASPYIEPASKNPKVYALRQRASLFGYNAPKWSTLPVSLRIGEDNPDPDASSDEKFIDGSYKDRENTWADKKFDSGTTQINLDTVYSQIAAGSWVVLTTSSPSDYAELYFVTDAAEESKSDYMLSAQTTRLTISGENIEKFSPRTATVFGQSEELEWAEQPITTTVSGNSVLLDNEVEGLAAGQLLIVLGTDATTGEKASEVAELDRAETVAGYTALTLTGELEHTYERDSVSIYGNVARATHGETKTEVLGSGDGSQSFQSFELKQTPLTYVSASTPSGTKTTLEVRVNNILWEEVSSLYDRKPDEQVYITRLDDDGKVTVQFGDGTTGARLPTGTENITATYRVGSGLDGMLDDEQISLLLTKPLGVESVVNPMAPSGADDPEELDDARENAPLTVLTLDRIVSVQDFEDFTRAFAGIGKAQATLLWSGERQVVHLTVAGAEGSDVDADSTLYQNLKSGIDGARHPDQPVLLDNYDGHNFTVDAKVLIDNSYDSEEVLEEVESALLDAFSFEDRSFAQAVAASEVLAVMQKVVGVIAVDLDELNGEDPFENPIIPAHTARWDAQNTEILPAELLTIDPNGITLSEMTQ